MDYEFPLARNQAGIYYAQSLNPNKTYYNVPILLSINHAVHIKRLTHAFNMLVKKYPQLTASIQQDLSFTCVNRLQKLEITIEEINLLNTSEVEKQALLSRKVQQPFDLTKPPLIRVYVLRIENDKNLLLFVFNHVIIDDLPDFFWKDLQRYYQDLSAPEEEPAYLYSQFVKDQIAYLSTTASIQSLAYWKQKLTQSPLIRLPFDKFPNKQSQLPWFIQIHLDEIFTQQISDAAKKLETSRFGFYLTAFFILLHKYIDEEDILIKTVINQQLSVKGQQSLGVYTNPILFRQIKFDGNLADFVRSVRDELLQSIAHSRIPFEQLLESTSLGQGAVHSHGTIVHHDLRILETTGMTPSTDSSSNSFNFEIRHDVVQISDEPLLLEIVEKKHTTLLIFKYDSQLYAAEEMQQFSRHYQRILEWLIQNHQSQLDTLEVLSSQEYAELIKFAKQNALNPTIPPPLSTLFGQSACKYSHQVALRTPQSEITYVELDKASTLMAHRLQNFYFNQYKHTPPKGTVIAIALPKDISTYISLLAVIKAGACYLLLDPNNPLERLHYQYVDSKAAFLITNLDYTKVFADKAPIFLYESQAEIAVSFNRTELPELSANDLAYIIYTSGSTGKPKGIAIEHKSIANLAVEQIHHFAINSSSRILQFSALSFDAAMSEIWCALLSGGTLCIPNSEEKLIGETLYNNLIKFRISHVTLPPSVLTTLDPESYLQLDTLVVAGESCSKSMLDVWRQRAIQLINAYGPSEATVCTSLHRYEYSDAANNIGKPLNGIEIYVLDSHQRLCPLGVVGELCIGGIAVSRGYISSNPLNSTRFIHLDLPTQPQWFYLTGDRVSLSRSGDLYFHGRSDNQVKLNGIRIEPAEIESIIMGIDNVNQCVVILVQLEIPKLVAIVQPDLVFQSPSQEANYIDNIREITAKKLPRTMRPSEIRLINSMPINSHGKIDKPILTKWVINSFTHLTAVNESMGGDNHEIFLQICANVLNIERGLLKTEKSFLDHGGSSLAVLKLVSKVKKQLNENLEIQAVFESNSLDDLAQSVFQNTITIDNEDALIERDLNSPTLSEPSSNPVVKNQNHILLTGGSGFLGIHLLKELLEQSQATVYCLVRANDENHAWERIHQAAQKYQLKISSLNRLEMICGDITKSNLGLNENLYHKLSETIEIVIHAAAEVNHAYPYRLLREANVHGVISLLNFAQKGSRKYFHYVSTLDTVSSDESYSTEDAPSALKPSAFGYVQSKWIAEHLVHKAQLPTAIYRPGNITGSSITGASDPFKNHALLFLKGCLQLRAVPNSEEAFEMFPVDLISNALIKMILNRKDEAKLYYNLFNPIQIPWRKYLSLLAQEGYSMQLVSFEKWQKVYLPKCDENNALFPFKGLYETNVIAKNTNNFSHIPNQKTLSCLSSLNITLDINYQNIIKLYTDYCEKNNFFEHLKYAVET